LPASRLEKGGDATADTDNTSLVRSASTILGNPAIPNIRATTEVDYGIGRTLSRASFHDFAEDVVPCR
jgi:hypothetical protein